MKQIYEVNQLSKKHYFIRNSYYSIGLVYNTKSIFEKALRVI